MLWKLKENILFFYVIRILEEKKEINEKFIIKCIEIKELIFIVKHK